MSSREVYDGGPNCDGRIDAGAYVLHALHGPERDGYAGHLRECAYCREDVERLQPIADMLGREVTPEPLPEQLFDRIMMQVRSEASLLSAAGAGADRVHPAERQSVFGRALRPGRGVGRVAGFGLPVAAVCALGIGLLTGGSGSVPRTPAPLVTVAYVGVGGGHATFIRAGNRGELVMRGLPQPEPGRIYQVWLAQKTGEPVATDVLFSVDHSGRGTATVPLTLPGVRRVMVTDEPAGGSTHPTGTPIVVATT